MKKQISSGLKSKITKEAIRNLRSINEIAVALKPHITANDLRVVMSDASCYESYVRFPTN